MQKVLDMTYIPFDFILKAKLANCIGNKSVVAFHCLFHSFIGRSLSYVCLFWKIVNIVIPSLNTSPPNKPVLQIYMYWAGFLAFQ